MSSIRTGTGLFSGIDIQGLTEQLIRAQRAPAQRMESRIAQFKAIQTGIQTLEASVLTLATSINQLNSASTFNSTKVTNSNPDQLSVTTKAGAASGTYSFQVLRTAGTQQVLSKGYANAGTQKVGAGTITISRGGELRSATRLDTFNGGEGVQRGSIRITDRSGTVETIDLSKAFTIDDVLNSINASTSLSVSARADGGRIVLEDTSGSTSSNLTVQEVGTGRTASDLGLLGNVSSDTLTGSDVYYLTGDFTLDQINDGIGIHQQPGADDLRISLADGTRLDIDLDEVFNLNEVLSAINEHEGNSGRLTAELSSGRLVLTDHTSGSGTLSVSDLNGALVVNGLGLDRAAAGSVLTGDSLLSGLGSRLIRNLRGGRGITTPGQISLTDRAGRTATVDLSSATSLTDIISAINAAEDNGTPLGLMARINAQGTGLEITDTSGSTAGHLIIADVGAGTVAQDLGLEVDAAVNSINSGSLSLRYTGAGTSLSTYAPDGGPVETGSFLIVDSAGNQAAISISSSVKTLGDVLQRINAAGNIQVNARLNDTGDGFVIEDEAGGSGTIRVEEISGSVAADLRIKGAATVSGGGQQISSRRVTQISVSDSDTLNSLMGKINAASAGLSAAVINDGSAFNSFRLALTSTVSGTDGRLLIDTGELDLGLNVVSTGEDALLQVGAETAASFLLRSSSGQFSDVVTGVNVTATSVGSSAATVKVSSDSSGIKNALKTLVATYNAFLDRSAELTKFDTDASKRGILQGQGIVLRIRSRLDALLTRNYSGTGSEIQSLSDLGVNVTAGGKLAFDEAAFDTVQSADSQGVRNFFLDSGNGAARQIDAALDSMTDTVNGLFKIEVNSRQSTIDSLQRRVDQIDSILVVRQERLFADFIRMEKLIGNIQSQTNALDNLTVLKQNRAS